MIKISKTINFLLHIWDFDAEEDAFVGGIFLINYQMTIYWENTSLSWPESH